METKNLNIWPEKEKAKEFFDDYISRENIKLAWRE